MAKVFLAVVALVSLLPSVFLGVLGQEPTYQPFLSEISALAQAQAAAQAAAEAQAIAVKAQKLLAELSVEALFSQAGSANAAAQASVQACAQASAQAATTAFTPVGVIPSIQASVQAFIDPECLRPTCEQYVPTQPTCPPTRDYVWDFGQVPAGSAVNTSKGFPSELLSLVSSLGVLASVQMSSTLPSGLSFEPNLARKQGKLLGTTPKEGESRAVVYDLLDKGGLRAADDKHNPGLRRAEGPCADHG